MKGSHVEALDAILSLVSPAENIVFPGVVRFYSLISDKKQFLYAGSKGHVTWLWIFMKVLERQMDTGARGKS